MMGWNSETWKEGSKNMKVNRANSSKKKGKGG